MIVEPYLPVVGNVRFVERLSVFALVRVDEVTRAISFFKITVGSDSFDIVTWKSL